MILVNDMKKYIYGVCNIIFEVYLQFIMSNTSHTGTGSKPSSPQTSTDYIIHSFHWLLCGMCMTMEQVAILQHTRDLFDGDVSQSYSSSNSSLYVFSIAQCLGEFVTS